MNLLATKCTHYIWEGKIEEANQLLKPYTDMLPRLSVTSTLPSVFKSIVAADEEARNDAIRTIDHSFILVQKVEKYDNNMMLYLAKETIELNKLYLNGGTDPSLGFSDEQLVENFKLDLVLCAAELYFQKGFIQFFQNAYIRGMYNLHLSYKNFNTILDKANTKKPNFYCRHIIDCAKSGMGTFQWMLSLLPGAFVSILSLIGFDPSHQRGLESLKQSFDANCHMSPLSAVVLAVHYIFIPNAFDTTDIKTYRKVLDVMKERQGDSTVFPFIDGYYIKKTGGDVEEAVRLMSYAIAKCEQAYEVMPSNFAFELVQCYVLHGSYSSARDLLEKLLSPTAPNFDCSGMAATELVLMNILCGAQESEGAVEYISSKCSEKAKGVQERRVFMLISMYEFWYLRGELSNINEKCARMHLKVLKDWYDDIDDDVKLSNSMRVACIVLETCMLKRAVQPDYDLIALKLRKASALGTSKPKWNSIIKFEMADLLFKKGSKDYNKMRKLVVEANSFKNFPFDDGYRMKINLTLSYLNEEINRNS
ncbi:tetratricopeptide repeat protein [Acrasis kona]|uniref:Tetratricopeptide repeat protein n=1 Tax=Acrasis kona TaxID=1008807 RepID=A0AAW2YQ61_9EUKA